MKKKRFTVLLSCLLSVYFLTIYDVDAMEAGYGWHVDGSAVQAVEKSTSMMMKTVPRPDLVVLYSTVGYDIPQVLKALEAQLPKETQVFGMTSCWGVVTPAGVHAGNHASLAMLGMSSDYVAVGVSGGTVDGVSDIEKKVASTTRQAVNNSGKPAETAPSMILMAASPGIEEAVIKGIEQVVGTDVPVYGGSAADNTLEGKWKVFANQKMYSTGFSLAVIYSDHPLGHAFQSGFLGSSKNAVATKVKGMESRTLLELDHQPAAVVYNEWAYDKFSDQLENGGSILGPASFSPLAREITIGDRSHFIGILPSFVSKESQSMELFANVKTGSRLYFTESTPDALIYRPATVARRALLSGRIKKSDAGMGLLIYCGGKMLAVQDRIQEIVPIVNKRVGSIPYIGAFAFGEQGNIEKHGNFHGNLMSSMVIMGKNRQ